MKRSSGPVFVRRAERAVHVIAIAGSTARTVCGLRISGELAAPPKHWEVAGEIWRAYPKVPLGARICRNCAGALEEAK